MVVCRDASVLAQLGTPDMRVPIAYGLSFPSRIPSGASTLNLLSVSSLTFEEPDDARFPGLKLAYDVLAQPEGSSVVLNAANEVAVEAFLARRVPFTDIHRINQGTLDVMAGRFAVPGSLEELLELDARSRSQAASLVSNRAAP
jgi:1-deoxy-D-xylulose-5-phosphate reductoisomerase